MSENRYSAMELAEDIGLDYPPADATPDVRTEPDLDGGGGPPRDAATPTVWPGRTSEAGNFTDDVTTIAAGRGGDAR